MIKPFALPSGYDWNVATFTKKVKTKTWAKAHKAHLCKWGYKLTNAGRDNRQIIGGILQAAYGVNIGQQIEERLSDDDLAAIRLNIIKSVY